MTRRNATMLGAAAALSIAGAAAAQNNFIGMGYVDGLQWQINRAAQTGVINNFQRQQLLNLQQRTRYVAWQCDSTGNRFACRQAIQNVRYINNVIGRNAYGGYDRYNTYNRNYNGYHNGYDRDRYDNGYGRQ